MEILCSLRRPVLVVAGVLIGGLMTGCGGSTTPSPQVVQTVEGPSTGTGTLTVAVADPEGRPLVGATVSVFNTAQTEVVGSTETNTTGVATIGSVPAEALVYAHHAFGISYQNGSVAVAQAGNTYLSVTLQAGRPRPTVALLPVSIPAGSVSADRSELTLEVTIVASAAASFVPAGYGDYSPLSTPSLGLALGQWDEWGSPRPCFVWLDRTRTVPSCGTSSGEGPYTVSVQQFTYEPVGTVPTLAAQGPARSVMLVMDQSGRVAELDPEARRSFAARSFIARALMSTVPRSLSVAGLAADGSDPAALPEQPLWPLVTPVFSTDRAVLDAAVGILEPLLGGSAPVFDALEAAFTLTAAEAPPGNRAVVALLGGGDDGALSDSARQAALSSLRQQREQSGIQTVLIAAAPLERRSDRPALAELSAALRAPAISLGASHGWAGVYTKTWAAGAYAALDLAADLIDGLPLPTLSAVFRVKAEQPGAFPAGATLHGAVFVESEFCSFGCLEIELEFAAEIP